MFPDEGKSNHRVHFWPFGVSESVNKRKKKNNNNIAEVYRTIYNNYKNNENKYIKISKIKIYLRGLLVVLKVDEGLK